MTADQVQLLIQRVDFMMLLLDVALWAVAIGMFLMVTGPVFFKSVPGTVACVTIAGLIVYVASV